MKYFILVLTFLFLVGCGSNENDNNIKLDNDTPIDAARTYLKSLCEDDYDLFLAIANVEDNVETQDWYDHLKRGYQNKNYEEVSLNVNKFSDLIIESVRFDHKTGEQLFYYDDTPKIVKILIEKENDGKYYFDSIRLR